VNYLQYISAAAYTLVGLLAVRDWLQHRDARRGYLALALGLLGLVSLLGQVNAAAHYSLGYIATMDLFIFQGSGFALLMFRDTFIPLPRSIKVLAAVGLFGSALAALVLGTPSNPNVVPTSFQTVAAVILILSWSICVTEPTVRFWLSSRGLPSVQRKRLRSLSLGYIGIVAILMVLIAVPRSATQTEAFQLTTGVILLLIAPLMYVSFSPPRMLRRLWRESEEEPFREAINELLLFSPSRAILAQRSLDWAVRLVGGQSGLVEDADGELLAFQGMERAEAETLAERVRAVAPEGATLVPFDDGDTAIVIPLGLDNGTGYSVVKSGPYTPLFGSDEVGRLHQYGVSMVAALDRARLSERMLALEEVKSRFLRLASHELRGPLSLVKGYMSMIEEGAISAEEMKDVSKVMLTKLNLMTHMLNEMLETARLEDNRVELKLERIDMRALLASAVESLRPLAGNRHRLLIASPEASGMVDADRARTETILTNLLDNAIKYSPRGGDVSCGIRVADGMVHVDVTDQGVGIAEENLPSLFTRFGRIQTDATTSIPGTGLGLYLSRELAHMQHGDITVMSVAGTGTTFTLSLPLAAPVGGDVTASDPVRQEGALA
jgi:signal transduction histidine kinase